ncbi:MAG: Cna B-type domain-containing protein [Eubacteriales bacterium]
MGSETVLNEDNAWSHTFTDLPQFERGKEIVYSIEEVDVPKDYTDNIEIGTDGNFTLTNSMPPATVENP